MADGIKPKVLVRIPTNSVKVDDADEEIFLLYTRLSARPPDAQHHGLGSVDAKQDRLTVRLEIPIVRPQVQDVASVSRSHTTSRSLRKSNTKKTQASDSETLEIDLVQDKTVLRTKKGDTGSVLWRVSVSLAQKLLDGLHTDNGIFNLEHLRSSAVLELGAGTGLLSLVLSPWVEHYTVTDLDHLIPLIRKNHTVNSELAYHVAGPKTQVPRSRPGGRHKHPRHPGPLLPSQSPESRDAHMHGTRIGEETSKSTSNVSVEVLDWLELLRCPAWQRATQFRLSQQPDVIFAADCVYNPALVPALVSALSHYAQSGRTVAVVAVELRAPDVLQEFMTAWLADGRWKIWRLEGDGEEGWLGPEFAVWIGWKDNEEQQ